VALEEDEDDDDDEVSLHDKLEERKLLKLARECGIRVVSAFEGYAFDYGMRMGDKLLTIDNNDITPTTSVEQVRNLLRVRGEPGTDVTIQFQREGLVGLQTVTMPRTVIQIRDVKLATLMGKPQDGIGYIQVTGFASNTGQEVRQATMSWQRATEVATYGERSLQGLIFDLREI
jgi:C-terminal processing protease CtpA/Prc